MTEAEYEQDHKDRVDAYARAMREMSEADRAELIEQHYRDEEMLAWYCDGMVMFETEEGIIHRWPGKTVEEVRERGEWVQQYIWGEKSPAEKRLRARVKQ